MYNFKRLYRISSVFASAEWIAEALEKITIPSDDGIYQVYIENDKIDIFRSEFLSQPTWATEVSFFLYKEGDRIDVKVGCVTHWAVIAFHQEGNVECVDADDIPSFQCWKDGENVDKDKRIEFINSILNKRRCYYRKGIELNDSLKRILQIKSLKEIAIESGIPYHTLYSFTRGYVNKLSSKNEQKLSCYLKNYENNKLKQKN